MQQVSYHILLFDSLEPVHIERDYFSEIDFKVVD